MKGNDMKEIKVFSNFFDGIQRDPRISIAHIAIFSAIFKHWISAGFELPIRAYSYELMPTAKLSSNNTYHRRLRELAEYGYIRYEPSFKSKKSSKIFLNTDHILSDNSAQAS